MSQQPPRQTKTRTFTASQVAEFEYCPLAWWHEQFGPHVHADTDELFARLVELEHEYSAQAPGLPEYRLVEGLLLRRGAFDEGRRQHQEHAEAVEDVEEATEMRIRPGTQERRHVLLIGALALGALALVLLIVALFVH